MFHPMEKFWITRNTVHAKRMRGIGIALFVPFCGLLIFAAGIAVGQDVARAKLVHGSVFVPSFPLLRADGDQKNILDETWNVIHKNYIGRDSLNDQALVYGAAKGMVEALHDPYTAFFDPKDTEDFLATVNGELQGIGAEIGIRDDRLLIIAPLPASPAERAGLRAQDAILKIDGTQTTGMPVEEAVARIRGKAGTKVTLTIQRGNEEPREISLVRAIIRIPSLRSEIDGAHIATITFYQFGDHAADEFQKAAQDILRQNAKGIILDMRNNPGGYLDAATDIADWLLPPNSMVVSEQFADGKRSEYRTRGPGSLSALPLVVLVNGGSASASEILAGALADDRSVPIVGEKTFGKGSVQELTDLAGGASIKLTVAHWLTPASISIQDHGIEPTVPIAQDPNGKIDKQLEKAREIMVGLIR